MLNLGIFQEDVVLLPGKCVVKVQHFDGDALEKAHYFPFS